MKLEKLKKIKQKIITLAIVLVTLGCFVVPNYSYAWSDVGETVFKTLVELFMMIPDGINIGLTKFFVDDNYQYSDMIQSKSAKDAAQEMLDNNKDAFDIPILGDIAVGSADLLLNLNPFLGNYIAEKLGYDGETNIAKIKYSPKLIFQNKVPALDANFFKESQSKKSIAGNLRDTIATWYVALRNIALVFMLLILVFIGIKITVSSVASDKAKYKQLLMDWIVGICLVIFVHYIMVFAVNLTEAITKMIATKSSYDVLINNSRTLVTQIDNDDVNILDVAYWALIYTVLTFYSLIFTWQYLKRIIKLAFLTLFAPIIAASYPIDKMVDGKSQGFDRWLKDYIFTLLIQPLHLIIYTILITSVSSLATNNPVYAIVALGSLIPIEKMLREYLGFERGHIKGPNPGGLLAAASIAGGLAKNLLPSNVKGKNNGSGKGNPDSGPQGNKPIETKSNPYDLLGEDDNDDKEKKDKKDENEGGGSKPNTPNPYSDDELDDINDELGMPEGEGYKYPYDKDEMDEMNDYLDNQFDNGNNNGNVGSQPPKPPEPPKPPKDKHGMTGNRFTRAAGGVGAVWKANRPKASNLLRKGAKIVGATTLGSAGLLFGAAAGIATGEFDNVAKYGITGLTGGAALGSKAVGAVIDGAQKSASNGKSMRNTFMSRYDPEKYKRNLQLQKQKQAYDSIVKDDQAMIDLRTTFTDMNDKQIRDMVSEYTKYNITDYSDIKKAHQLERETGISRKTVAGAMQLSKNYDRKELRNNEKDIREEIEYNLSNKSNSKKAADDAVNLMKRIYRLK